LPGPFGGGCGGPGGWGVYGAAVPWAVGEAAALAAQGSGAAAPALAVEELALAEVDRVGVVAVTEGLAGESATGAGLALVECGAETWHGFPSWKQPVACGR
jgi:hypothetical protein